MKLDYFRISGFWHTKTRIKFKGYKDLALYPLNFNKIYKIQWTQILSILSTKFILLYNQRDAYYYKYYIQFFLYSILYKY